MFGGDWVLDAERWVSDAGLLDVGCRVSEA